MQHAFHLPDHKQRDAVQIFTAAGVSSVATVGSWQVWKKPKWAKMVSMFCLGSGASGAGGAAGDSSAVRAGGGAGACSGYTKLLIPAIILPDFLYVSVGVPKVGGASGAVGILGMNSHISAVLGSVAAANLYLISQTTCPAAPAAATTTGAVGVVGTIGTIAGNMLAYAGEWSAIVSIVGTAGSVGAADATGVTAITGSTLCAGTGGGGMVVTTQVARAGGLITGAGPCPSVLGGLAGSNPGQDGYWSWGGLIGTGGTGGGSKETSGTGGNGGRGAYGCGGGGGGAGATAGGRGGDSGGGLVIITCF